MSFIVHMQFTYFIHTYVMYLLDPRTFILFKPVLINFASTVEFAKTWGRMKSNRSEEMNYEKMSRAMRYHYGCERQGRKGHLAMVKEKRLCYRYIT